MGESLRRSFGHESLGERTVRQTKAKDIGRIFAKGTAIDEAVKRAARRAIEQHRRAGLPLVVYRDGKIAWVPAEELEAQLRSRQRTASPLPPPASRS